MSKLLILYIWALSLAHLGFLGSKRYMIIGAIILMIVLVDRKVYISDSYSYKIGGAIFLGSGLIATMTMGTAMSWTYVFFTTLNFLLLPVYARYKIPSVYVMAFVAYIFLTFLTVDLRGIKGADSIYGNANNFATIILCTSYFAILAFKGRTILQMATVPVFCGLMLLTASRTQLAAILIFYSLYFGQRLVRIHFRRLMFLTMLVMFALYATLISGDPLNIIGIVQENTIGHKSYRGLSDRDVLLFISFDIVNRFPLGVGWGESGNYIVDYIGLTLSPHNTFAKVAVEGGIGALVGYLLMLLGLMYSRTTILSGSFMIAIMLRSLFESSMPFSLSFVSTMLILPFFFNENSVSVTSFRKNSPKTLPLGA